MRRIRSRGRRRRLAAGRTDWIVGSWGGVNAEVTNPADDTPSRILLIDEADLEEHVQRLTILRIVGTLIVGSCNMRGTPENTSYPVYWKAGIIVQETQGDTVDDVLALDPSSAAPMEESWLWVGADLAGGLLEGDLNSISTLGRGSISGRGYNTWHIDTRCKRKMHGIKHNCSFVLAGVRCEPDDIPMMTSDGARSFNWTLNLRILVKTF